MSAMGLHTFLSDRFIYDQTPPITKLVQIPLTKKVRPGELFRYVVKYSKRHGCKVVSGGYNLVGKTRSGRNISILNFNPVSYGTWEAGENKTVYPRIGIPPDVPAGIYDMWWHYCWVCEGARGKLCVPNGDRSVTTMRVEIE